MQDFHVFDKSNEGIKVKTNINYVKRLNDRELGGYFSLNDNLIIRDLKECDYYISFHFLQTRFLKYDDWAEITIKNKHGNLIDKIILSQTNKYPQHTFLVKKENIENNSLELIISQTLYCDDAPILAGISWSDKLEKEQIYNSIPIAFQGFTGSGAGALGDIFSEYKNIDFERDAELRFLGRYNQLINELSNHPEALEWNDGCLKHFINQMYFFYNKKNVHGYEISNIFDDNFLLSWNKFFAELVGATEYLDKKLEQADFRFPTEYSEEYKNAPFVKDGKIFYFVSKEKIARMNNIAANALTFLNQFKGKKFRALNNLCCRLSFKQMREVIQNTKIIAVWRDPRSQYSQVINRGKENNIPIEFSDVETFIQYFKNEITPWINSKNPNVLVIRFEDLCLNYEKNIRKIEKFVGLESFEHAFPKMFFNPIHSIPNVNYWKKADCLEDIKKIHKALPEYCCDFKKNNWFKYQIIRFLSHVAPVPRKKYLKEIIKFYKTDVKFNSNIIEEKTKTT